jgi:hypothetical protein
LHRAGEEEGEQVDNPEELEIILKLHVDPESVEVQEVEVSYLHSEVLEII